MKELFFAAKKITTVSLFAFFGMSMVSPEPQSGDLTVVLNVAKIAAYIGFAILCWKVLRPITDFIEDLRFLRAEHRVMMSKFWETHPDMKDDFYATMGRDVNRKTFFYNGRKA